jgi:asparagine N-glycosylation enzyme membrane subunit Stt3
MISDDIETGLEIYAVALIAIFVAFYAYYFYKTIADGKDRDLGIFALILFSILGSPFIAYAFVKSTKQDSDRIKVKATFNNGETLEITLTHLIREKISTERIIELTDINQFCRECGELFNDNETACIQCKKKRVWYFLHAESSKPRRKILTGLHQWKDIPDGFRIKSVKRRNTAD